MIPVGEFERALALVRRSEAPASLEARLRPEGTGGRPRALDLDVLLAAMLLTHTHHKGLMLTAVHKLLTTELAYSYQCVLGIVRADGTKVTIRQVRYILEAIERKYAYTVKRVADLDDEVRQERKDAFQQVIDQLLAASIPAHLPRTGLYAVDASAIDSAARGKKMPVRGGGTAAGADSADKDGLATEVNADAEPGSSFDPDARWGHRTKTYDNKTTKCFGYQLIVFTRVGVVGQEVREPLLTDRIVVVPANASMAEPTLGVLDRMTAQGHPAREVIVDRGFSYAVAEKWADQLRDRDIGQVLDLHNNDRGVTDYEGVKMIAGWAHCPAMPAGLDGIDRPVTLTAGTLKKSPTPAEQTSHRKRLKEIADFEERIAEREKYAFVRVSLGQNRSKTGKTGRGSERFSCPAQAGKLACPACPLSMAAPAQVTRVANPPTGPGAPKACSQRTITIPATVSPKVRQLHRWGSPEWVASFNRRTRVEGAFGLLKNSKSGNVKRGWTAQVGIIKTTLLLAIAVTASNLRQLLIWAKDTGDLTDPLTRMEVGTLGFEEIAPSTGGVGATSPPTAA